MAMAFDLENSDSFELTQFDINKIEDLEISEKMSSECGNFDVVRAESNRFILFLTHEGLIRKHKVLSRDFKTSNQLIKFLKR